MAEQKRTTETQDEKLRRQEIKQEAAAREAVRQAAFPASGGGPVGPPDDISIQAVAARLGDTRFQTAQRQAMANQTGRVGGNWYLQQVIAQKGQEEREHKRPGAQASREAIEQGGLSSSENPLRTSVPRLRVIEAQPIQRATVHGYDSPEAWAKHLDSLSGTALVAERRKKWDYHLRRLLLNTLDNDLLLHHTRMREALRNVMDPWATQIGNVHSDKEARLAVVKGAVTGIGSEMIGKIPVIGSILNIGFGVAADALKNSTVSIGDLPKSALTASTEKPNAEQNENKMRTLERLADVAINQLPNSTFADLYYNDARDNQRATFGMREVTRGEFQRDFFESTTMRSWIADKAAAFLQAYQRNVLISEGRVPRRDETFAAGSASGIWKLRSTSSEWVAEIESAYGSEDISTDYLVTEDGSPVPHRFPMSGMFQDVWDVVHGRYRGQSLLAGAPTMIGEGEARMSAPRRLANDHPVGAIVRTGDLLSGKTGVTDPKRILGIVRIVAPELAGIANFANASAELTREYATPTISTTLMAMMREGAVELIDLSTQATGKSANRSPLGFEVRRGLMPITNLTTAQMRELKRLAEGK